MICCCWHVRHHDPEECGGDHIEGYDERGTWCFECDCRTYEPLPYLVTEAGRSLHYNTHDDAPDVARQRSGLAARCPGRNCASVLTVAMIEQQASYYAMERAKAHLSQLQIEEFDER